MKKIVRRREWGTGLALTGALLLGCYRGGVPPQLCEGAACDVTMGSTGEATTGAATTVPTGTAGATGTTGVEPTTGTGVESTTGAPVDDSITFRIDSLTFVDPHLFLASAGDPPICINDVTEFVNVALADDAKKGQFNLLARFENYDTINEMRLVDADCEDPAEIGGRRRCTPSMNTQAVLLTTKKLSEGGCSDLDPVHFQAITVPDIHDPQAPCVRSNQIDFSIPISNSVGALNLRAAQFSARLDTTAEPLRLEDGLLFGFLTKAVAASLNFESEMFGTINLWSLIDSPACVAAYSAYLPSIDEYIINDMPEPGVWLAINFTAERVDYVAP